MFKKIAVAFCAIMLLSGCSSSNKRSNEASKIYQFENNIGDRVFFALAKDNLSEEAKTTLKKQAEWLNTNTTFNIVVEGHCDERGTREYNIALGERRAHRVKYFLAKNGVNSSRIETVSYGKERPAVIGSNEDAWSQNRRAVVYISR
jgi:peptidoglycan-associated lipoprotein